MASVSYTRDQLIGFISPLCRIRRSLRKTLFSLRIWRPVSHRLNIFMSGQLQSDTSSHANISVPSEAEGDSLPRRHDVDARDHGFPNITAATRDIGPPLADVSINNVIN